MAKLWERLRGSPPLKGAFLYALVASLALFTGLVPSLLEAPLADAERLAFDQQMRLLRSSQPRPIVPDVVLVGIDDETERRYTEPVALWHKHFAPVLHALAKARPRVVGVDVVLPERSYDSIVPGGDLALMRGLLDLKRSTALVYVQTVDNERNILPIQPNFRNIITPAQLGIDQQEQDPDGSSRRFIRRYGDAGEVPTLVGQMLRGVGLAAREGFIDYSLGTPLDYVPIHEVAGMSEERLRAAFQDRVVLVGSLLARVDRWRLPVRLMANDPGQAGWCPEDRETRRAYHQPG